MIDYEVIFERKQHHLTTPQKRNRRLCFGNESIIKAIKNQDPTHDLFITKYADDNIVQCIILDYDNKENPELAFKDARKLRRWTNRKGLNTVIVKSGSKGYHCYIQTVPRAFGNDEHPSPVSEKLHFQKYVEFIIGLDDGMEYPCLDLQNLSAGLRGNIRVIGSIHPKTGERCRIVEGEFLDFIEPTSFEWDCFQVSQRWAKTHEEQEVRREREAIKKVLNEYGVDPVADNDLRTLMPSLFGGEWKAYEKGYIMMQCPFHSDSHPSMKIWKEFYYCLGCGETGNWWTLRKKGYVDFEKEELIRVGKHG